MRLQALHESDVLNRSAAAGLSGKYKLALLNAELLLDIMSFILGSCLEDGSVDLFSGNCISILPSKVHRR